MFRSSDQRRQSATSLNVSASDFFVKWRNHVLILGCGTGNPYFTTDTTAVLRGIEVEADICLFAKNVDGVYTADPKKDPNAKKYDRISYGEMLEKDLKVIDAAAAALCRDNDMPVLIFDLGDGSNIEKAAAGEQIGTVLY